MLAAWLASVVVLLGTPAAQAPASRELFIGCGAYRPPVAMPAPAPPAPIADDPELVERGRLLVEQSQCGRCHALPATVAATPRERSCAGCHAWVHATVADPAAAARERRRYPLWDRYMS